MEFPKIVFCLLIVDCAFVYFHDIARFCRNHFGAAERMQVVTTLSRLALLKKCEEYPGRSAFQELRWMKKAKDAPSPVGSAFCVYWSATENNTNNAWRVRLSDGDTNNNNKDNSNYVRCVRGRSRPGIQ